jgi:hypothetical protein
LAGEGDTLLAGQEKQTAMYLRAYESFPFPSGTAIEVVVKIVNLGRIFEAAPR